MGTYQVGNAQEVLFKDYAPDLDLQTPGIVVDMDGYTPSVAGYTARNSPVEYAPALPGGVVPTGGYVALFSDGSIRVYAGSINDLWRLNGVIWENAGSGYITSSRWRFAQFGDDVIAVADGTVPQVATSFVGNFAALAGGPPADATNVISIASLVFMSKGPFWYNSAVGVDNDWVANIQTLAANGELTDYPGAIVALAPIFRNVVLFKQGCMLLGQLVGGTSIWDFQLLSDETGTWCQESVIVMPESVAFLGTDDFYITTGNVPQRIPNNLKEWFFATADQDEFSHMLSWYDRNNSIAYWHFVSRNPPIASHPDLWVAYNVRANRWAKGTLPTYYVIPNTQIGAQTGLYFDSELVLNTWTGTPGEAFLKTGYVGDAGHMTQMFRVRPKYLTYPVPPNPSPFPDLVTPFHTQNLGQPPTQDSAAVRNFDGWHYYRAYDRFHQVQIATVGPCELVGVAAEFRTGGVR